MLTRRRLLAGGAAMPLVLAYPIRLRAQPAGALTPEMFGAKGDGRTDDSAAFAALSARITAERGGRIVLRRTTYRVGTVPAGARGGTNGARIISISGCTRPLVIEGNGATLRCAPDQRFGAFEPDGSASTVKRKTKANVYRPYQFMILVRNCSGGVAISNLELDGNLEAHVLGGRVGDSGWQIGCSGVALRDNSGPEALADIHSHHHAQDGFYIDGPRDGGGAPRRLTGLRADANGRQGMSIVGGQGYRIERCSFTRTARGKIASPPRAGVDIEAQRGKKIRGLRFTDCRFVDNRGCGLVADSGDSADCAFDRCTFVGTATWALWPDKPGFRFDRCTIAGSLVNAFASADPALATQFTGCTFTDDPRASPTGAVYLRKNLIADLSKAQNVLFDGCTFRLVGAGVLPWSKGAIYKDCTMSQKSAQVSHPRGTYRGTTRITGRASIGAGSRVEGVLTINGKRVMRPSA